MDWKELIPSPDVLPAAWGIFETLDVLTFVVHILFINVVVGGSLFVLVNRLRGRGEDIENCTHGAIALKIPSLIALSVTIGVAPLLFVQVLYGHLIYSSSVLMATYWILVIPVLILGYYGAYIFTTRIHREDSCSPWATIGITVTVLAVLYIAFMFVNNMTLMLNPQEWTRYFGNRDGFLLNLGDPTIYPRYLHFLTASIAVAGLASAVVWSFRKHIDNYRVKIRKGLRIFAFATMIQVIVGVWLLLSIPSEFVSMFMGGSVVYTGVLGIAIILGLVAIGTSIRGMLWPTVWLLVVVALLMGTIRAFVRAAYISRIFTFDEMTVSPQYGPMILFVVILLIGLVAVGWMIKMAIAAQQRRVAQ